MPGTEPAQAAFNKAIREFRAGLKDQALYSQILATTSVDQVYDLTDKLQKTQGKGNHLRNLTRIQPYLERMRAYTDVIDTFVQAKPDILALIWGPIKLLIQWTSTLTKSLDALLTTTKQIGNLLSEFDHAAKLFGNKRHINEVLALVFQDILDFYLISLKFFRMDRWKSFFEALWPKKKEEIERVIDRMNDHTYHLRNEVRLEAIQEAYDARQQDIENFAKLEEANRMQEYAAIETAMAPNFYSKELNFLRGRVCEGTGDWLIKDPDLSKWMQVTQDSQKMIWLCGIPGAGKTYLAACVVNASKLLGHTLFAFLSHKHRDTSAISVIHSLIFQLARKDPTLQDMVRYTNRDPLEFDLPTTIDLLTKLIRGAGPVRIVVDGLDEIDDVERVLFLRQMLKLSSDCDEVRVLISSRPEADITALLEKPSKPIRVDAKNTASIHTFVMGRYNDWLQDRILSPEDETEIARLIGAVADQAKGMFLYAHLILKSLDFLHSVAEIRHDLRVLPTDLNAAYGRIFTRINESLPDEATRKKARKALGWIGYSPVPLTIRELEQALIINIGDLDQDPTGISTLQLVRLCGPVVEEVDDELQFVHFTAKEYLFSPMIQNSLDPAQCIMSLAKCCITYLCQHHHDGNIDDNQFQDNVIRGVYRLHHFASDNWSRLVEAYLKVAPVTNDSPELKQFVAFLDLLASRASEHYLQSEERVDPMALKVLQTETSKDTYELVCNEFKFHREASTRLFELGKGEWQAADPLLIRYIAASLHKVLEMVACPPSGHQNPCYCQTIHRHYGRPFKCSFVGCDYQRLGFETHRDRHEHSKFHDRPWTCEVIGCEYHDIGFVSRQMRDRHLDKAHRVDKCPKAALRNASSNDEMVVLLKALIRANKDFEGSTAKQVFDRLTSDSQRDVLVEAVSFGTYEQMEILCPESYVKQERYAFDWSVVKAALESQNRATLRWIQVVSSGLILFHNPVRVLSGAIDAWEVLLKSDDPESMYQYVETLLHSARSRWMNCAGPIRPDCINRRWIKLTNREYLKETLLISTWNKLYETTKTPAEFLSVALCSVAITTHSIRLARWLCEHGASVNYLRSIRMGPPLFYAAKTDTLESAEFMRFILYQGADPECNPRSPNAAREAISTLRGPSGLYKWLKISWEELIEEAKEARRNNDNLLVPID